MSAEDNGAIATSESPLPDEPGYVAPAPKALTEIINADTEDESLQRYEAASTIYGPNTLQAYLDQYANLTENLLLVSSNSKTKPQIKQ